MGYKFTNTNDGSVGLFDEDVDDIYHSSSGAYKEAIDKFILSAQLQRYKNESCKVLDICYGIGYNTKALLKYSLSNNLNITFQIDAIELNQELIEISPFIKNHKNDKIDFEVDKFLLSSYFKNYKLINFTKIKKLINKNENYLTLCKPDFEKILSYYGYKYGLWNKIKLFLHNIYYHNESIRNKNTQKPYKLCKNTLNWHVDDARKAILELSDNYDIIFLDAFDAKKQPTLWTHEFLSQVVKKINKNDGILLSYSSASPFRKTLLDLGMYVGKYYDDNCNITSTIGTFNKNLIKYEMNSFELGLLNTKAGIKYEDKNLSLSAEEILNNRKIELDNSDLESTSKYYKRNNRRYGKY